MAQSDDNGGGFVILAIVGFYFFSPASWTNGIWYGIEYQVSPSGVHTDDKPTDCDFMHAPLGSKDCSYKSYVKAYNSKGALVAGEDAPKYGHDTKTGKPIISYDNGKTWDWYPLDFPDLTVASVQVLWRKE